MVQAFHRVERCAVVSEEGRNQIFLNKLIALLFNPNFTKFSFRKFELGQIPFMGLKIIIPNM